MKLFENFESEQSIVDQSSNVSGFELHLKAVNGLIRSLTNKPSAKILARVLNQYPSNPFFQFLHNKYNNQTVGWSIIASRVLDYCPSNVSDKETYKHAKAWLWEKENIQSEVEDASLWDCIFMANLLEHESKNEVISPNAVYEWNAAYRFCARAIPYEKVVNSFCGKPERIVEVTQSICSVYVNGQLKILQRGQEDCPSITSTYKWETNSCFAVPEYKKVPNSNCGKESRQVQVQELNCVVTNEGEFVTNLYRGQQDCPAAAGAAAQFGYSWKDEQNWHACYQQTSLGSLGDKVLNSFCGQPARIIEVQEEYCSVYVDGDYTEMLSLGEQDCVPVQTASPFGTNSLPLQPEPIRPSTDMTSPAANTGAKYLWEDPFIESQPNSASCNKYENGNVVGKVENSFCNRAKRLLAVKSETCSVFIDGSYETGLLRGEKDCPAK